MTMSSAASAFGWQRRKESDDIKPLVPEGWSFRHDRRGSGRCFELFGFARVAVVAQFRWTDDCLPSGSRINRLGIVGLTLSVVCWTKQAVVGKTVFTAILMIAHPLNPLVHLLGPQTSGRDGLARPAVRCRKSGGCWQQLPLSSLTRTVEAQEFAAGC